jgi:two-component system NarL family sensor kinase
VEGLDGSSLAGSLDALARRTTEWYGLQCELHDELTGSDVDWLDEMTTTQLFHIAREAIHNMVKHAQAKRAWLKLEKIEDRICLTIGDDGVGIPQGEALPGIGLRAMQRRASVIGADLTVESNQGKGTVIRCKVAIDEGE